jgi:hypothetical protein
MAQVYLLASTTQSLVFGKMSYPKQCQACSKKKMPGATFVTPSIHVGNALCWVSQVGSILEFDIENQSLGVTEKPPNHLLPPTRKVDYYGTARLVLQETVELHKIHLLGSSMKILPHNCRLWGFDEESNVIFLCLGNGVFTVNLETLQVRNTSGRQSMTRYYYPYRNFYAAGNIPSVPHLDPCI